MFNNNGQGSFLDALNRTLLIGGLTAMILSSLVFRGIGWLNLTLSLLAAAMLIFAVIRMFAGRPDKRYRENQVFLTMVTGLGSLLRPVGRWLSDAASAVKGLFTGNRTGTARPIRKRKNPTWAELKAYKYFFCPQCTRRLRVPRGKGKVRVTCTTCGNVFEIKS